MEDEHETTSLRQSRHKKSSMSLTSCFIGSSSKHSRRFSLDGSAASSMLPSPKLPSSPKPPSSSSSSSSSSMWCRSKQPNFISRRHRRYASADFSYNPQSYALNFEDEGGEEVPLRKFSARFAPSSPRMTSKTTDGVVANARAAAVAEVKSSLEEERSPREILVALG